MEQQAATRSDLTGGETPGPTGKTAETGKRRDAIRFVPAAILILVVVATNLVLMAVAPYSSVHLFCMFLSPGILVLMLAVWLLGFSPASGRTRVAIAVCFVVAHAAMLGLIDRSASFGFVFFGIAATATLLTVWGGLASWLGFRTSAVSFFTVLVLALVPWALVRSEGSRGDALPVFGFRWSKTSEERVLEALAARPKTSSTIETTRLEVTAGDWLGFRGADRDSRATQTEIRTDWNENPPRKIWSQPVGPGWSSFAAIGDLLYTQEQRGDFEAVVCYLAESGEEVWVHRDKARFEESAAGPGPRATPTFRAGRLFTLGATGILNCLDARTGSVLWTRRLTEDHRASVPQWGFAGSPLVLDDQVIVSAGGPAGHSLACYHPESGEVLWSAGDTAAGYGSPQLLELGGIGQVVVVDSVALTGYDLLAQKRIWQFKLDGLHGNRNLQPCQFDDKSVLLGLGDGIGTRRLEVVKEAGRWQVKQLWHSKRLKPKFSDVVLHKGNVFGIDARILACLDAETGKLKWKGGRYGQGQILLVEDWLLILAENGEVILVEATSDEHREVGRFQAIEGKTWNHPVLVRGRLYARNGQEMACYDVGK